MSKNQKYDVAIVGGGPGGLSAALALGRARKQVLLCDSGPRRNAAAVHIQNFVTRDGTAPDDFRSVGQEQLRKYPNVTPRDVRVEGIEGARGSFRLHLKDSVVKARRVLLCTGMIDGSLPVDGFDEFWGHAIYQCPYCHGWEIQDRRWGCLIDEVEEDMVRHFALLILGWASELTLFTTGKLQFSLELTKQLTSAGAQIQASPVRRLHGQNRKLESVELVDGTHVPCDALFAHPPQRQVPLVESLGLTQDGWGFIQVDPISGETSRPGIYAAGDLSTRMQAAILAAAGGMRTAAMINAELTAELAMSGELRKRIEQARIRAE